MQQPFSRRILPCALLWVAGALPGQDFLDPGGVVTAEAKWSMDAARPGDVVVLALVATIQPGFHINAGQSQLGPDSDNLPTEVTITRAPDWAVAESVRFPEAHPVETAGVETPGFDGEAIFFVAVQVAETAPPDAALELDVELYYQACDHNECKLPKTLQLTTPALPIKAPGTAVTAVEPELFDAFERGVGAAVGFGLFGTTFNVDPSSPTGLLLLLLVAALGGVLLNFTPCVLPVIPIKIISLSKVAENRRRSLWLGATMSLGVIAFWLGLAVAITAVSGFTATNELFQYPWFTITVGVVIALLAIGMCGLFSVRLPSFVYGIAPRQETAAGSFGLGVMTAILSTPCTAPFMGTAAVWAAGQQAGITLATFGAIGTGMALPYLVLAAAPGLVKKMPRSGPASQLIKEVMGLFLLAAGAYFIGTGLSGLLATPPDPPTKLHWWPVMGLCAGAGIWLAWRTLRLTRRALPRIAFGALGLLVAAGSVAALSGLTAKGPVDWVYYTEERFEQALQQGKVVVMDFTAEWCLNCKALEHNVLYRDEVAALLNSADVVPIKVDITGPNPAGKKMLQEAGSLTIPLLAIYKPGPYDREPVFKSDAYTPTQVIDQIKKAVGD
jgi:thiol:disulfide interchange protein DsbD